MKLLKAVIFRLLDQGDPVRLWMTYAWTDRYPVLLAAVVVIEMALGATD